MLPHAWYRHWWHAEYTGYNQPPTEHQSTCCTLNMAEGEGSVQTGQSNAASGCCYWLSSHSKEHIKGCDHEEPYGTGLDSPASASRAPAAYRKAPAHFQSRPGKPAAVLGPVLPCTWCPDGKLQVTEACTKSAVEGADSITCRP